MAAPCVGPIVVGLLVLVGAKGDAGLGFLLFFVLALGLGAPYVALGAAAGSIAHLPRSGEWLVWVERLFGFLLLGLALYFLSPLLPPRALTWSVAALLASAAFALGFQRSHGESARGFVLLKRTAGTLALLTAVGIVLRPATPVKEAIHWRDFSAQALAQARSDGLPAVVDFRADWCLPCIEMDKTTFVSPAVAARATTFAMLRADVTETSKETDALLATYGILGVPTTLFFSPDGIEQHRLVGYVGAEEFMRTLDETRGAHPVAAGSQRGAELNVVGCGRGDVSGAATTDLVPSALLFGAVRRSAVGVLSGASVHRSKRERTTVFGLFEPGFPRSQKCGPAIGTTVRSLTYEHLPRVENTAIRTHDSAASEARLDSWNTFQLELLPKLIIEQNFRLSKGSNPSGLKTTRPLGELRRRRGGGLSGATLAAPYHQRNQVVSL